MQSSKILLCLFSLITLICSAQLRKDSHYAINKFKETAQFRFQNVRLSPRAIDNSLTLNVVGETGATLLTGQLGISSPSTVGQANGCTPDAGFTGCFDYGDYAKLQLNNEGDNCTKFVWTSTYARRLEDCFNLETGVHWYGGGETFVHTWPIEGETRREHPVVTGDSMNGMEYGGVTENYWLVSSGVAIQVDEDVPLFISWGSVHPNQVCLVAMDQSPYHTRERLELKYSICTGSNLKDVHQKTLRKYYPLPPSGPPDRTMLLRPFWSTWAQYHADVNQSVVIEYAQRMIAEGFTRNSHIEIDDDWESCYGEAEFNTQKFPNVTEMMQTLNSLDLKVTLWIHPFINYGCPSFVTALANSYFVRDQKSKTGITQWWAGTNSGAIDFTNEAAVTWWKARLESLQQQYNIDSYKFDAGETNWLPHSSLMTGDVNLQPNLYTTKYVESLVSFGGMLEVRVGRRNQREPIFTRMLDKDSRWGHDNGLRSLIPTLLHFSLVGYPFVLPDMIGGNAYNGIRPSAELYVRWMQANAFMPAVQFSLVPWDYDAEVIQLCKDILALREEYQDLIYKALDESLVDASPINRPMWWEDPEDVNTYTIDSQYLLGGDIIVAPILHEGETARDVYLTRGTWVDPNGVRYTGPQLISNFSAPLNTLPYFIKESTLVEREKNKKLQLKLK